MVPQWSELAGQGAGHEPVCRNVVQGLHSYDRSDERERGAPRSAGPGVAPIFLMVAALLISSVGITYWAGQRAVEGTRKMTCQRLVIEHLDKVLSTVRDAETGQRGISWWEPNRIWSPTMRRSPPFDASWRRLPIWRLAENFPRKRWIASRSWSSKSWPNWMKRSTPAVNIVWERRWPRCFRPGRQVMEELRSVIGDMRSEEETKFSRAALAAERASTLRTAVFLVAAAVNLAFLAWAHGRIAAEINRRETALSERDRHISQRKQADERTVADDRGTGPLEPRPRAIRIRGLARPAGALADGHRLSATLERAIAGGWMKKPTSSSPMPWTGPSGCPV